MLENKGNWPCQCPAHGVGPPRRRRWCRGACRTPQSLGAALGVEGGRRQESAHPPCWLPPLPGGHPIAGTQPTHRVLAPEERTRGPPQLPAAPASTPRARSDLPTDVTSRVSSLSHRAHGHVGPLLGGSPSCRRPSVARGCSSYKAIAVPAMHASLPNPWIPGFPCVCPRKTQHCE